MERVAVAILFVSLLGVAGCGEDPPAPPAAPSAHPEAPDPVAPGTRQGPKDVVRIWLDSAKRGDGEAMSALWAEEERPRVRSSPHSFAAEVASGALHAATWDVGAETGKGAERAVTAHVVWREHPDGGDNLEFRFVRRDGRWWLVGIAHYD